MYMHVIPHTANPPAPSRPSPVHIGSSWIQLRWDDPECDGGHHISSFTIEYSDDVDTPSYRRENQYIRNINRALRSYTITNLRHSTEYKVRIQAISADTVSGSWSTENTIVTLPPGMFVSWG